MKIPKKSKIENKIIIIIISCLFYYACDNTANDNRTSQKKLYRGHEKVLKQENQKPCEPKTNNKLDLNTTNKISNNYSIYEKVEKAYKDTETAFNIDLMSYSQINEYIQNLIENGSYEDILIFLTKRESFTGISSNKKYIYALYSNALLRAESNIEEYKLKESMSYILDQITEPQQSIEFSQNVFNSIKSDEKNQQIYGYKISSMLRLVSAYLKENRKLEDIFQLFRETKNGNAYKSLNDNCGFDAFFFAHIAEYIQEYNKNGMCPPHIKEEINEFLKNSAEKSFKKSHLPNTILNPFKKIINEENIEKNGSKNH